MPTIPVIDTVTPASLPIPPEGAFRVIHACNQDTVDAPQLGKLLEQDPVLTVEILRIVNSAFFGFSGKITSVAHAVAIIGQHSLRHIVLCVAMRDALKPEQLPALSMETFWSAALRRAVCARTLASRMGLDKDLGFTVGLLQDFGLLVLFYLYPHRIAAWPELAELDPDDRYALEQQLFEATHDEVGRQLAQRWNLPDELILTLGYHHRPPPPDTEAQSISFCHLAQCADWMAAVFTSTNKHHTIGSCRTLLKQYFTLTTDEADNLLAQINEELTTAAQSFGFDMGEQTPYETLMQQANMRLLQDNLNIQEMNWHLEQILKERDRIAAGLKQELDLARDVQRSLLPADSVDRLGVHGLNLSAKAVSGDFYDFYKLHTGKIAFCIADVSGKGMHAALMMAKASSLFHCLGKSIHDPAKLLSMINREIIENAIHGMFITMAAGVIDPETFQVVLSNAGHLPVLRLRHAQLVAEYAATAPPIGVLAETRFQNESFKLDGDSLYLYTDGLLEAKHRTGEAQGKARLLALFGKHAAKPPMERLQHIVAGLRQETVDIEDDMTLLLIEART